MTTDAISRNLRVLLRADAIIADIRLRHVLAKSGLDICAGLIALFGLLMFEVAGYFALQPMLGPSLAAFVLGAINIGLALLLAQIARRLQPSRELALAQDLHTTALNAVLVSAVGSVRSLQHALHSPVDALLPGMVVPLLGTLLKSLRSTRLLGSHKTHAPEK